MAEAERSIPTVLLVDDDARVLAAGKSSLGGPRRILTARTVDEARAQCAREAIQTAIIELRLGAGCGLDLVRTLKRDHPAIRTALFTGALSHEVTAEAALAGARVIACKPYPLRRLLAVLETTTRAVVVLHPPPPFRRSDILVAVRRALDRRAGPPPRPRGVRQQPAQRQQDRA